MKRIVDMQSIGERLDEIDIHLAGQIERERAGESLEGKALDQELDPLRLEVDRLAENLQQVSGWVGGIVELEREAAVAGENLTLARLALQRARAACVAGLGHEALHDLCDAAFHVRRCLDQVELLENDTLQATRRLDRDENRRDFLSG